MIENIETLLSSDFTNNIFNDQEFIEPSELILLPRDEPDLELETFSVVNFNSNISGFEIDFNRQIHDSLFELYRTNNLEADLMVLDDLGNFVDGSIIFNEDFSGFTFVKTGDVLEPGNYSVRLKSGADGVIDTDGELLDGNQDGTVGDDYTIEFTIDNPERILSISDLILASEQTIENEQLIVSINNGAEITNLTLELEYDPNFLNIDTIELVDGFSEDWNIETDLTSSGIASVTLTGNTPLSSGEQNLFQIQGNVPETATYGASQTLSLYEI